MRQFSVTQSKQTFALPWKLKLASLRFRSFLRSKYRNIHYPYELAICLTSKCNSKCDNCPRTRLVAKGSWEIRDMGWSLLTSIIQQVAKEYPYTNLMLGGEGEPLLYPLFDDFIFQTRNILPSTPITLYSNVISLDEHFHSIINNVTTLVASLNFVDPEYYRKRTGVDRYYQVVDNLRQFLLVKGNRLPSVKIQLFTVTENMKSLHEFVDEWKPILNDNDDFMLVDLHNFTRYIDMEKYYRKPPHYNRFPCRQLFLQLYISASGHVYPCCMGSAIHNSGDKAMCLGHLSESSITELVNGEKLKQLRESHLNGVYPNTCRNCDVWKTFNNFFFKFNGRWF